MAPSSADAAPPEFSFRTRRQWWDFIRTHPDHLFNVAVIGGGIVGAGLLREMSLRGAANVVLFEKNDYASGTSGASSKLIHAGIRYLEQVWIHLKAGRWRSAWTNLRFVFQASGERKRLMSLAPHLVKAKPIYFVIGRSDARSPLAVFFGVWTYYLLQLCHGQFFSRPRLFLRSAAIRAEMPELAADQVKAVFTFWDSETDDARLVIENLQSAAGSGAWALNYVEMTRYEIQDQHVRFDLRDRESGETASARARILVNASGPFVDEVRRAGGEAGPRLVDRIAGSHLNIYPAVTGRSYYITAGDRRLVFLLKRDEDGLIYTRIGTTERPLTETESSETPAATKAEIDYLTELTRTYFPDARVDSQMINHDAGIRPLRRQDDNDAYLKSREHDIVVSGPVVHVVGVKLTDYRRVAGEIIAHIPWREWGVVLRPDALVPLRDAAVRRLYLEASPREVAERTMVVHWSDYVLRRRGLAPLVDHKTSPDRLRSDFLQIAEVLTWDERRKTQEWTRLFRPS